MKKVFRIMLAVCLTVLLAFTFVACGNKDNNKTPNGDDPTNPPAEEQVTITFNQTPFNLIKGKTEEISVTVTGSDEQVKFTSSSRNVLVASTSKTTATVEGANTGKATITATIGDVKATLSITVIDFGLKLVGESVLSIAPGKTNEFSVKLQNMPTDTVVTVESDSEEVTANIKEGSLTPLNATIEFTGAANAELGKTAKITVKATGVDPIVVEVDTYSDGILFGDGHYQARYLTLNEFGVVARGVGRNFSGGELVIPRRVYYTPEQNIDKYLDENAALDYGSANKSFWAPVTCLGVRTGDNQQNQPSMPSQVWKFDTVAPFYIDESVTVTSLNTGDSVQYICEKAFQNYGSLTKVHIGKAMIHICDRAFYNEDNFSADHNWEAAATYTFNGTVTDLTFAPDCGLGTIGDNAFAYNKLTKLILPDSVAVIADGAFWKTGVEVLKLPVGLTKSTGTNKNGVYLHGNQFMDLVYLKELYIPWQINYSMDADKILESANAADKAKADALAEQLGITGYEYVSAAANGNGVYANSRFTQLAYFCVNGNSDAFKDFETGASRNLTVYYMGPEVLMTNLMSVQNKIAIGNWYQDAEGNLTRDDNNRQNPLVYDATGGRRINEYGWVDPICDHFLQVFCTETTKNVEPYGSVKQYELGNGKVKWVFDAECPHNVDGIVKQQPKA